MSNVNAAADPARAAAPVDAVMHAALVLLRSDTPVPRSLGDAMAATLRRRLTSGPRDAAAIPALPQEGPSLEWLAAALDRHLGEDDRRLLARLGDELARQEVSAWLGSARGATRVRVLRLRERLRDLARRHVATLAPDERTRLERWLQRAATQ